MARSSHVAVWKERLQGALSNQAQATADLIRETAVPASAARMLLKELVREGIARETTMPRTRASGNPPTGWLLKASIA